MIRSLVLVLGLMIAGDAQAAAPQAAIIVPDSVQEHHLVKAASELPGTGYAWFVLGPAGFAEWEPVRGDRSAIVFTGPPGQYQLMLVVQVEGGGLEQAQKMIAIVGAEPQPQPNPQPHPNPQPNPTPGKATYGVIIEERDDRDDLGPQRAMVMESEKVRSLFAAGRFHCWDDDVAEQTSPPPGDAALYADRARKLQDSFPHPANRFEPMYFLMDDNLDKVWEGPVPANVPAAVELTKRYQEN